MIKKKPCWHGAKISPGKMKNVAREKNNKSQVVITWAKHTAEAKTVVLTGLRADGEDVSFSALLSKHWSSAAAIQGIKINTS